MKKLLLLILMGLVINGFIISRLIKQEWIPIKKNISVNYIRGTLVYLGCPESKRNIIESRRDFKLSNKKKDAKDIAKKISKFMQENKYTISDINRSLVVLSNMEYDYEWKNGLSKKTDKPEKVIKLKEKKLAVLEESCSTWSWNKDWVQS